MNGMNGDMDETMCHTVTVSVDGVDVEVCVNHPYENSHLDDEVRAGRTPNVTENDVKRALDHYYKTRKAYDFNGRPAHMAKRGPHTVAPDDDLD